MNTALILKSDGLVYVCRLPEDQDQRNNFDFKYQDTKAFKQKAIKEAVLCADQKQARKLICDNHTYFENKDTPYIIPGLDFRLIHSIYCASMVSDALIIRGAVKGNCNCKPEAILLLPKQEENEQEALTTFLQARIRDTFNAIESGGSEIYPFDGHTIESLEGMKRAYSDVLQQHYTISKKL
jgi:hypothetical protein